MGANNKIESYLNNRLNLLQDKRVIIIAKIKRLQSEISDIHFNINDIEKKVDTAFEVFSPRPKLNDNTREELKELNDNKKELTSKLKKYEEELSFVDSEISEITDVINSSNDNMDSMKFIENKANHSKQNPDNLENTNNGGMILELQEEERKRIARELHDSTVQILTNTVYRAEMCSRTIDTDKIRAKLELEIMAKNIKEAINEMRTIIYNLRPIVYEELENREIFENILSNIKQKLEAIELHYNIIINDGQILSDVLLLTAIRIIQEACNNAVRHSGATNICVNIEIKNKRLEIVIEDDGKGFLLGIERDAKKRKSYGLSMMRERVKLLNGQIKILTDKDSGTHVFVSLPINNM